MIRKDSAGSLALASAAFLPRFTRRTAGRGPRAWVKLAATCSCQPRVSGSGPGG